MRRLRLLTVIVLILLGAGITATEAKVVAKTVDYTADGMTMKGYLAYDDKISGKRPGFLVVHEWWGLNDFARKRAEKIAELGYTALAVDMYGNGKIAAHPDAAGKFSSELMKNFDVARARFRAAEDFLRKQPTVDTGQIGAIGYCFGGGVVLNMAAQGADLKTAVSFHGTLSLVKQPQPGEVKAKMLKLHGGKDKFSTPEQIDKFKKDGCCASRLQIRRLSGGIARIH